MAVTISGDGTITGITTGGLPNGCVTADDIASGVIPEGGKVLQVVSTTKTDTFTTSSTSDTLVTGLTVNITPSSTSSKILVFGEVFMSNAGDAQRLTMYRDSTAICVGDTAGTRPRASAQISIYSQYWANKVSASILDEPSTTSQITYSFKVAGNGSTVYVNRTQGDRDGGTYDVRGASTITAMEIAG